MGLEVSFGKHVADETLFNSSSIENRLADLHEAFLDKGTRLILPVVGGYSSNQLLSHIDYNLITKNPKAICGSSDITALISAIYVKTGLTVYSGPMFFHFGERRGFNYSLDYFKKCLFSSEPFDLNAAEYWSNDRWAAEQEDRLFIDNSGYWVVNQGEATGTLVGGNLTTLNLLQGTEYFPVGQDSILFIEATSELTPQAFERNLQALTMQTQFMGVRGLLVGRFPLAAKMSEDLLAQIVKTKKALATIPVVANMDFGHTSPMITLPIGGQADVVATGDAVEIKILRH